MNEKVTGGPTAGARDRTGGRTGLFGNLAGKPTQRDKKTTWQPVIGNHYGGTTSGNRYRPVITPGGDRTPGVGRDGGSFFAHVDRGSRPHRTGHGYFESVNRLRHEHRDARWSHNAVWWWWYPYDFRFYHWYYGYYDPFAPDYPFAVYSGGAPAYYYYLYRPPLVLVTPPALWITIWGPGASYRYSGDEDYYPYVDRVDASLAQALRDIERGWAREEIGLLMRHVDADGEIRVLYKKEYSHTLRADEFQQLTEEAFANTRTESFRFTAVKRHREGQEAVAKGKHVLRDPNGESRVVYVIYLMEQARDRYGDWDWYITEVGQSPEPY